MQVISPLMPWRQDPLLGSPVYKRICGLLSNLALVYLHSIKKKCNATKEFSHNYIKFQPATTPFASFWKKAVLSYILESIQDNLDCFPVPYGIVPYATDRLVPLPAAIPSSDVSGGIGEGTSLRITSLRLIAQWYVHENLTTKMAVVSTWVEVRQ